MQSKIRKQWRSMHAHLPEGYPNVDLVALLLNIAEGVHAYHFPNVEDDCGDSPDAIAPLDPETIQPPREILDRTADFEERRHFFESRLNYWLDSEGLALRVAVTELPGNAILVSERPHG